MTTSLPILSINGSSVDNQEDPLLASSSSVAISSGNSSLTNSSGAPDRLNNTSGSSACATSDRSWREYSASLFSRRLMTSGGVTWILKGLCVCMAMMLIGGVGSITLRQMVSPQIDSLMRERSELQIQLDKTQRQVANMTRIAESRQEMIHLLEKELERQAVNAVISAQASAANADKGGGMLRSGGRIVSGSFLLPTIFYSWILGVLLLMTVLYRISRIIQVESRGFKRNSSYHPGRRTNELALSHSLSTGSASSSSTVMRSSTSNSPPRTLRGIIIESSGLTASGNNSSSNAALSPTKSNRRELSPQCYKRAPGNSPTDRLMHV